MNEEILIITILGLIIVTLIDCLGSIVSRRLNFNYAWFSFLTLATYTLVPYFLATKTSFEIALASNCIVGLYDATIGHKISIVLKANTGEEKEDLPKIDSSIRVLLILIISFILTYVGYVIGSK